MTKRRNPLQYRTKVCEIFHKVSPVARRQFPLTGILQGDFSKKQHWEPHGCLCQKSLKTQKFRDLAVNFTRTQVLTWLHIYPF